MESAAYFAVAGLLLTARLPGALPATLLFPMTRLCVEYLTVSFGPVREQIMVASVPTSGVRTIYGGVGTCSPGCVPRSC